MSRDLAEARELAVALAVEVGRMQVEERGRVTGLSTKSHANDLVSHIDIESEKRIVGGILARWPDDGVLAEENHQIAGQSGWNWVIDPLDGTRNYLSGAGPWSVCIALQSGAETVLGVVHNPALGETFCGLAGLGATLNGDKIAVSEQPKLSKSIVGFSFNPSPVTKTRIAEAVSVLLPVIGDLRRVPSAIGLSYLASGRFDCCLLLDTQPWDIAAAQVIAAESGAVLGAIPGTAPNELLVGAGEQVWAEYLEVLRPILGPLETLS